MFRWLKILILLIMSGASTLSAEEKIFKTFNKNILKNIEINDSNNLKVNINDLFSKNQNYIINFWAVWCLPCKKELPELQKIHIGLIHKNIKTYIISIDKKNIKKQLKYLEINNVDTLVPFFDQKMIFFNSLKLRGIPSTIIINKQKKMAIKEGILEYNDNIMDELNIFFN